MNTYDESVLKNECEITVLLIDPKIPLYHTFDVSGYSKYAFVGAVFSTSMWLIERSLDVVCEASKRMENATSSW